jgi:hypothetical protein
MSAPELAGFALPNPEPVGDFDNANPNICPNCGDNSQLKFLLKLWVELLPDGVELQDQAYMWENENLAECICGWAGTVGDTLLRSPVALTLPQSIAAREVYRRDSWTPDKTFDAFLQTVTMGPGCVMVPWAGMHLGIEPDGYVHS